MLRLLADLWHALDARRRRRATLALLVMGVAGGAEFAALMALRAFLSILVQPADERRAWLAAAMFGVSVIALSIARLATLRLQDALVLEFASVASIEIFARAMRQPYVDHKNREAAELFAALENTQRLVNMALGPLVTALVNASLAVVLVGILFTLAPVAVASLLALLVVTYGSIGTLTGARLRSGSKTLQALSIQRAKLVHEAQDDYRHIRLTHAEGPVTRRFGHLEAAYRQRQASDRFAAMSPRVLVEMVVLLVGAAVACVLGTRPEGIAASVPLIGALALGFQRLLPLVNSCYTGWGLFQANSATLADTLRLMQREALPVGDAGAQALPFERSIALEGVTLHYPMREAVLRKADLVIRKGDRIGIVGASGAGKSTLIDLLLGLLPPTQGALSVDDHRVDSHDLRWRWQMQLACVSQAIHLRDATVRDVVTDRFEGEAVDEERLAICLRQAHISSWADALAHGLDTRVGDAGQLLSGGQRQRIALARALYRRAKVLVLDEATSQLDESTESGILETLDALGRSITVLVVTHRRSALARCDRILEVRDGRVLELALEGVR
jgi:ABC-type multidrug transport system fused ATPase/permease subunit